MEKEIVDIDTLIMLDFLGELSPENRIIFDRWMNLDPANRRYYAEQKKLWKLLSLHEKMHKINEEKAFQKISSTLFAKKNISFWVQLQRIAAVLFLPLLIYSGLHFYLIQQKPVQYSTVFNTAETPPGMRLSLILPDGTKVWLNAGSKLTYPVLFSDKFREVKLSGEAFFEVEKNKRWPFIVSAGNMNVVVTGTMFNCNAYPENKQIETVLVEGRVKVINAGATEAKEMEPGELASFNKDSQQITTKRTDLEKYIAWKSGKLMFRDDNMSTVVEKLQRWYNVKIVIEDKEISDYVYTATFIDESLDQVLKMLSLSAPIRYTVSVRTKQADQTFVKQTVKLYKKNVNI
jgi:ferric-dicitrate binding protein FerR (iron transport regulator)